MTLAATRGQIYRADIGHGPKPWLIVSNNRRNRQLPRLLAVRITPTDKYASLPTVVPLSTGDPLVGYIVVDDLQQLRRDELKELLGTVAPATIMAVNTALKLALAIP
ncbi:type II toxin-antitoxin system PemK/MazF family toxin [Nocardia iowensis]|uniref:Type II toxin-antitoxin system PemK/MazF family toxin n=1 Tax=Nocardia iowensis TaxID=204891 RepID=A0ABX8RZE9_NOCIO|nr:type II toxin-antitoxin system PemK/MazF family toxin [Nocardia iowensis]QXN93720.1 type II toxin-antitoxin system PemK/MazF family toxin [Nocardia iowensis]